MQSGKTAIFQRLCGDDSIEIPVKDSTEKLEEGRLEESGSRRGWFRRRVRGDVRIIDSPGTATLQARGSDEAVTRDALLRQSHATLLVVLDQKNMRRSLALALNAAEHSIPMVVAVNMKDEAERHGVHVDYALLESILGVDVVPTAATLDEGTSRLALSIRSARVPPRLVRFPSAIEEALALIEGLLEGVECSRRGLALMLLAGDRGARDMVREKLGEQRLRAVDDVVTRVRAASGLPIGVVITDAIYEAAGRLAAQVVREEIRSQGFLDRLGRWSYHPILGPVIALLVILAVYAWVGLLGGSLIVGSIEKYLFKGWLVPLLAMAVEPIPWAIVRDAFMDPDFGLVTTGIFLAFGVLMPAIFMYYFALALLTQSGYIPRLSILLDRLLRLVGLSGKGIVPMVMGLSCITVALVTTRTLETRKQRIIASLLLVLGMPCAPLLSVMLSLLGDMPWIAALAVFGTIAVQIIVAGVLANALIPGLEPDFLMVIPPLRVPALRPALRRSARQAYCFMKEAVPFFLAAAFALFVFDRLGGLALLERAASPIVGGLLGLPDEATQVFVRTFVRRESGAAELVHIRDRFDNLGIVVTLLVMTLLTPCVNAIIVLAKERGIRAAALIVGVVSMYALAVGGAVNHLCRILGITFT